MSKIAAERLLESTGPDDCRVQLRKVGERHEVLLSS
jgi:hypothetical protein